jgi:ABC-2 type transport system ATP-binding protein
MRAVAWQDADNMLKNFDLDNKLDWFPAKFSKGMQQKVMIVAAFMTHAQFLLSMNLLLDLIHLAVHDSVGLGYSKKGTGGGVDFMSTHILATAQQYADEFVLIKAGKVQSHW